VSTLQIQPEDHPSDAVEMAVEFRVSRPGSPRRRLRLVGPLYTLGSGQDCSVRLEDAALRPLHAVLRRRGQRFMLKACGAPIVVNGTPTLECQLSLGDRLQLGSYEFELLAYQPATPSVAQPTQKGSTQNSPAAQRNTTQRSTAQPEPVLAATDIPMVPGTDAHREARIVPRRRISFADTAQVLATAYQRPSAITASPSSNQKAAEVLGQTQFHTATIVPNEASFESSDAEIERIAQLRRAPGTSPDERAVQLLEQHSALLANERRWQERSRRQLERFRQRERRGRAQVEQLIQTQENVERRTRETTEAVQNLGLQLTDVASQISLISGSVLPAFEQRLELQQADASVALNKHLQAIDTIGGRLDQLQAAIAQVQSESREVRQESAANRNETLEALANAEHLETLIQRLTDTCNKNRVDFESKLDELRESLFQQTKKTIDTSAQVEESRQCTLSLSALVQQVRSAVQNLQSDAQRFVTSDQLEQLQPLRTHDDDRIARLADIVEAQQTQMQREFELLYQRLEDTQSEVDRAVRSASDALTRAVESQGVSSTRVDSSPEASIAQWPVPEEDEPFSAGAEPQNLLDYKGIEENSVAADDLEPQGFSQFLHDSQYPQDVVRPWETEERYSEVEGVSPSTTEDENSSFENASPEHEELSLQSPMPEWFNESTAEESPVAGFEYESGNSLSSVGEAEDHLTDEYIDGSTYQYDPGSMPIYHQDEADESLVHDSPSPQRSAAEILSGLGMDYGVEEDGGKTEYLPIGSGAVSFPSAEPLPVRREDQPTAPASAPARVMAEPAVEEEEDSIEAYMNRLLKRVQGTSDTVTRSAIIEPRTHVVEPTKTAPGTESPSREDEDETTNDAIDASQLQSESVSVIPESEYVPRRQAPERNTDLLRMRELANSTARIAIAKSARQRLINQIMFKFALFTLGVLAGLFTLAGSGFALDKWFLVAMCCFGLGAFYLMEGFGLRRQLLEAPSDAVPTPVDG
jgi:hypothetical protein